MTHLLNPLPCISFLNIQNLGGSLLAFILAKKIGNSYPDQKEEVLAGSSDMILAANLASSSPTTLLGTFTFAKYVKVQWSRLIQFYLKQIEVG